MKKKLKMKRVLAVLLVAAMLAVMIPILPPANTPAVAAGGTLKVTETEKQARITVSRLNQYYFDAGTGSNVFLEFALHRDQDYSLALSVDYRVLPGSAQVEFSGGLDQGTITFNPGDTNKTLTIPAKILGVGTDPESRYGGLRHCIVQFTNPVNAILADTSGQALNGAQGSSLSYPVWLYNADPYTDAYNIAPEAASILQDLTLEGDSGAWKEFTGWIDPYYDFDWTDRNSAIKLVNAVEDSNANGVRMTMWVDYLNVGGDMRDHWVRGYVSATDSANQILYNASDYDGWPWDDLRGFADDNSVSASVFADPRAAQYAFTRSQFLDYMQLGSYGVRFYNMFIQDLSGNAQVKLNASVVYFLLLDYYSPVIKGITAPHGFTYYPGDVIPVTVEFSEAVAIDDGAYITVNGQTAPYAAAPSAGGGSWTNIPNTGKYHTFLYTVQDVDNAATLVVDIPDRSFFTDIAGNELALTESEAAYAGFWDASGLDLTQPYSITGMNLETPLATMALGSLTTDLDAVTGFYDVGEKIVVTLTDHPDATVSAWLRSSLDVNNELAGAYVAVRNPDGAGIDTFPLEAQESPNPDGSVSYLAEIPVDGAYATEGVNKLQIALYYGLGDATPVTRDTSGVFSGGQIAYDKLLYANIAQLVEVTDIIIDTTQYPAYDTIFMSGYKPITLTATVEPTDATFPKVKWSSSDTSVAVIDEDDGTITPVSSGKVIFTATAFNGFEKTTPEFTVDASGLPFIEIPAERFNVRQGEAATVRWITNLDFADTEFTVKFGPTEATQTEVFTDKLTDSSYLFAGSNISQLSIIGADMKVTPAYYFTISAPNPKDSGETLSATGRINVYPQPAAIRFEATGDTYITDATTSANIAFTVANLSLGDSFELTVLRNGTSYDSTTIYNPGDNSYNLSISKVAPGQLRDEYSIQAIAANASGAAADAILLYVYNDDALQLLVSDALGAPVAHDGTLTLSNRNPIATLYNTDGSQGLLDLKRDVSLQQYISINYSGYAWSIISDQIEWLSDNTAVATVNYRQGTVYEPLELFTYVKYSPATTFSLAGVGNGNATISATHSRTGQTVSLDLTVETLQNQLYLFQFYPKQVTNVSYFNGEGATVNLQSDADGALAVYEPSGVNGSIAVQSRSGDTVYLGTFYYDRLKSGEFDSANRGLYPVNIMQLRNARLEVFLKTPDGGSPWYGEILYSGAVYKNGALCPDTVVRGVNATVPASGKFQLDLNASKFWVNSTAEELGLRDKLEFEFVLECGSTGAYYPVYLRTDGNLNSLDVVNVGAHIAQLRNNPSREPNPFLADQRVTSPHLIGARDVLDYDGNVGPGNRVPQATLASSILWWGADPDLNYGARLETDWGAAHEAQTTHTRKLPFIDMALTLNEVTMNNTTVGPGSALNLLAGQGAYMRLLALDEKGGLAFSRNSRFRIVNGIGLQDPEQNAPLQSQVAQIQDILNNDLLDKNGVAAANPAAYYDIADILDVVGLIPSVVSLGNINITYEATSDPFLYYVYFDTFEGGWGDASTSSAFGIGPADVQFTVNIQGEVWLDTIDGSWHLLIVGGGVVVKVGFEAPVGTIMLPLITVQLNAKADVGMAAQFNQNADAQKHVDILLSMLLDAGIRAKVGLGFGNDDFGVFAGVYGELLLRAYFGMLNIYAYTQPNFIGIPEDHFDLYGGISFRLAGEVGATVELTLLFFSTSVSYTIYDWELDLASYGNMDKIQNYVETYGIKDMFGQFSAAGIAQTAFDLYSDGREEEAVALVKSVTTGYRVEETSGGWTLEDRAYLDQAARTWESSGMFGALAAGSIATVQKNAYPYSAPMVTSDGKIMLYRSDGDSHDVNDTNISWASGAASVYQPQGAVDTGNDALPAAGKFALDGNSNFAVAAWEAQSERFEVGNPLAPSADEIEATLNQAEIVAAVYDGSGWEVSRLTDNNVTDVSPAVAANNGRAFAAWRNAAGGGTIGAELNALGPAAGSGEFTLGDVSNRIFYSRYNSGTWSEPKALLSDASAVGNMDAAMLADGTTALVYTSGGNIQYLTLDASGNILRNASLSAGGVNRNPQVKAARLGDGSEVFLISWYQEITAGGSGVSCAALTPDGIVDGTLTDAILTALAEQNIAIGANFDLAPDSTGTLDGLSVLWSEYAPPATAGSAASSVLYGVRLNLGSDGSVYFTAPQLVAEALDQEQIASLSGWSEKSGANRSLSAVMLLRDLSAVGVRSARIGKTTMYIENDIGVSAYINQEEIVHDFRTTIPFYLTNNGGTVLNSATVTLDGEDTVEFQNLDLLPNQTATLYVDYSVPGAKNSIRDLRYIVVATFTGGSKQTVNGTLDLAIPNAGITSLSTVSAADGERVFRVSLENRSDVEFFGNTADYTAHLGIYTDAECQKPAKDAAGNTMVYTLANPELELLDDSALTKLLTYKLPAGGFVNGDIRLYARAWAEENGEEITPYYHNGSGSILFQDPVAENDGNPIRLEVSQSNVSGVSVATVTVANLALTPANNGNLVVTLLGPSGTALETLLYANSASGLINLDPEASKTFTFTFTQAGYSVQAGYYTADTAAMNADLASLKLSAIALAFDKDTLDYNLQATNIGSTTLTAASVNPKATLTVLDAAGQTMATGIGAVACAATLANGTATNLSVVVQPEAGNAAPKTYALNITGATNDAGGIVISAANGTVTITDSNNAGFVPATWQYNLDGEWSGVYQWSATRSFQPGAEEYTALYVRVFDPDGRYMDSNMLSVGGANFYTVSFDLNGGTRTGGGNLTQVVAAGGSVVAPTATRNGYTFDGWDRALTNVQANLTITAQWTYNGGGGGGGTTTPPAKPPATPPTEQTAAPSDAGQTTDLGDGSFVATPNGQNPVKNADGSLTLPGGGSITAPDGKNGALTITTPPGTVISADKQISFPPGSGGGTITDSFGNTFQVPESAVIILDLASPLGYYINIVNPFRDVNAGDWFYNAVLFAYAHGLMVGTNTNPMLFSPDGTTTRSMIVTVLYRMQGSPDGSGLANPFDDVAAETWYTDAVKWAAAKGIVTGVGDGLYNPDALVTRQDLAVILARYADYLGINLPGTQNEAGFIDEADIADYAQEAIDRFFRAGVINGYQDGGFKPQNEATRAEVAAMLMRFREAME